MSGKSMRISGFGTPTSTTVPARSRAKNACSYVAGRPIASIATSTPFPSVNARTASMTSSLVMSEELIACVAPKSLAHSSFWLSKSIAIIVRAPAIREPSIAASPTPPHPQTATVSPRVTPPVFRAAPSPAITPQPIKPATSGSAAASTFVACPAATKVFSANAPIPKAGERSIPSTVIFCCAL